MKRRLILEAASSADSMICAMNLSDDEVRRFDVVSGVHLGILKVPYDFGGTRLILSRDGNLCFSASYRKRLVACADVKAGAPRWCHHARGPVQTLSLSRDQELLYCGLDDRSTDILLTRTGKIRTDVGSVAAERVFESPIHNLRIHEASRRLTFFSGDKSVGSVTLNTFAVIAHCFTPGYFCISESGGNVRFFAVESLSEVWAFKPRFECHFISLVYSGQNEIIWGMEWPYVHGGPYRFVEIDVSNGVSTVLSELGTPSGFAQLDDSGRALASDGEIFDIRTGQQVSRLKID